MQVYFSSIPTVKTSQNKEINDQTNLIENDSLNSSPKISNSSFDDMRNWVDDNGSFKEIDHDKIALKFINKINNFLNYSDLLVTNCSKPQEKLSKEEIEEIKQGLEKAEFYIDENYEFFDDIAFSKYENEVKEKIELLNKLKLKFSLTLLAHQTYSDNSLEAVICNGFRKFPIDDLESLQCIGKRFYTFKRKVKLENKKTDTQFNISLIFSKMALKVLEQLKKNCQSKKIKSILIYLEKIISNERLPGCLKANAFNTLIYIFSNLKKNSNLIPQNINKKSISEGLRVLKITTYFINKINKADEESQKLGNQPLTLLQKEALLDANIGARSASIKAKKPLLELMKKKWKYTEEDLLIAKNYFQQAQMTINFEPTRIVGKYSILSEALVTSGTLKNQHETSLVKSGGLHSPGVNGKRNYWEQCLWPTYMSARQFNGQERPKYGMLNVFESRKGERHYGQAYFVVSPALVALTTITPFDSGKIVQDTSENNLAYLNKYIGTHENFLHLLLKVACSEPGRFFRFMDCALAHHRFSLDNDEKDLNKISQYKKSFIYPNSYFELQFHCSLSLQSSIDGVIVGPNVINNKRARIALENLSVRYDIQIAPRFGYSFKEGKNEKWQWPNLHLSQYSQLKFNNDDEKDDEKVDLNGTQIIDLKQIKPVNLNKIQFNSKFQDTTPLSAKLNYGDSVSVLGKVGVTLFSKFIGFSNTLIGSYVGYSSNNKVSVKLQNGKVHKISIDQVQSTKNISQQSIYSTLNKNSLIYQLPRELHNLLIQLLDQCEFQNGVTYLQIGKEFQRLGYDLFVVGGCTRDILKLIQLKQKEGVSLSSLKESIKDIDLMHTAPPKVAHKILEQFSVNVSLSTMKKGIVTGGPRGTGLDLVSCRVHDPKSNEIKFGNDFIRDSNQRDFYCNTLYISVFQELLIDPTGKGYTDCMSNCLTINNTSNPQNAVRFLKFVMRDYGSDPKTSKQVQTMITTMPKVKLKQEIYYWLKKEGVLNKDDRQDCWKVLSERLQSKHHFPKETIKYLGSYFQ